eukprot:scaffold109812_cov74-Phaeocystis_antarctica.AAC.1
MGPCTLTTLFGARAKGGGNYSGQRVRRFVIYALPEHALPGGRPARKKSKQGLIIIQTTELRPRR